ncbi:hypothetical protein [Prochlorococcus marinus]|uniref:hypothetical protein n=1 Tax=Prochlorococcus marinus TaxID=1219 RepID=UPI0022B31853|nr:hypothetical protein [Prochlorococcus marinus]
MDQIWEIGISKFRSCGGVAENIFQKVGINGRGIFPVDPKLKSKIFVPSNLLINREDVILKEGQLKIKDGTDYSKEVVDFFNFYQKHFSWGNGGKESTEAFEKDLAKFPEHIKDFLREKGIIDINQRHNMLSDEFIHKTFLINRGFKFKGKIVLAPYLELVNYSPKSSTLLYTNEGIYHPEIDRLDQEITHHYCYMSSLARWILCGFSVQEPMVFSLPLEFRISESGLKCFCKGKYLDTEQINFPRINKSFIIEGLPIANINLKNFPMNYLSYLSKSINVKFDLDNILEKIIDYNIKTRIEVIEKIGGLNSFYSKSLIKSLSIELQTIDNSF